MAVGDLYEVTFQYAISSREFNCVFGYEMTAGTPHDEVCQHLAETYLASLTGVWLPVLATDVSLECVVARAITKDQAIPGLSNFTEGVVGTGSGVAIPAVSAWVAKFITDNPLPIHNGRKFISGVPESFMLSGQISAAALGGPLTAWAAGHAGALTTLFGGDEDFDPVVINRRALGLPIIPPTGSIVTSVTPLPTIYQQRGRKTKRTQVAT